VAGADNTTIPPDEVGVSGAAPVGESAWRPARLKSPRLFEEGLRLLVLRLAQYVLLFVSGLVLARTLGPTGRAHYALPLALAVCVQLLVSLSLEYSTGRMLARREATVVELARLLMAANLVLGGVGIGASIAVGLLARGAWLGDASASAVVIAAATIPFGLAQMASGGLLVRLGALRAYGWTVVGAAVLQLGLMVSLSSFGRLTPDLALVATFAGYAASAAGLTLVLLRRIGRVALVPRLDMRLVQQAVRQGLALHLSTIGMYLNFRVDLFLVAALLSAHEAGLYSLAVSLAEFVFLGAFTLAQSAMRVQTEESEEVAASYTLRFVRRSWLLAVVLAALTSIAAYPFVLLAYGSEWTPSVAPLVVLTLAAVAMTLEAPLRTFLVRVLRPGAFWVPATSALAVNVGANLALIPIWGITGAALASLISYGCYGVLLLRLFRQATGLGLLSPAT
jgi:O-antigen/teichoic acid export membrane protein